jgi:hypothetical protein
VLPRAKRPRTVTAAQKAVKLGLCGRADLFLEAATSICYIIYIIGREGCPLLFGNWFPILGLAWPSPGAWMMCLISRAQTLTCDVCVELRRPEVTVPEQHLYGAGIRPSLQKVRGETVAQAVWRHSS